MKLRDSKQSLLDMDPEEVLQSSYAYESPEELEEKRKGYLGEARTRSTLIPMPPEVEDQDKAQAGFQAKPSGKGPAGEPIYLTNIPEGTKERAEDDASVAKTNKGARTIDISEKKKESKPPAWVGQDIDLSDPNVKEGIIQAAINANMGGIDWRYEDIAKKASDQYDPAYFPKEYETALKQLKERRDSAVSALNMLSDKLDQDAVMQGKIRNQKAKTQEDKIKAAKDAQKEYLDLGAKKIDLAKKWHDLKKEFEDLATSGDPKQMVSINRQIKMINEQLKATDAAMQKVKPRLGQAGQAQAQTAQSQTAATGRTQAQGAAGQASPAQAPSEKIESVAKKNNVSPQQVTKDKAVVDQLVKTADSKGLKGADRDKFIIQGWDQYAKQNQKGGRQQAGVDAAKIIEPAPTDKPKPPAQDIVSKYKKTAHIDSDGTIWAKRPNGQTFRLAMKPSKKIYNNRYDNPEYAKYMEMVKKLGLSAVPEISDLKPVPVNVQDNKSIGNIKPIGYR